MAGEERGVIEPCYNIHVAVDTKNHLIADYNVTNSPNYNSQLSEIAIEAKETLGAVADKGFSIL